jgi:hypothetical protein
VSRRTIFWLVVALAGTILLAVVGAIVFSLLDKNGALGLVSDLEDETPPTSPSSGSCSPMRSCRSSPARPR